MDYANDAALREAFQEWIAQIWAEKDRRIESLLGGDSGEREQDTKAAAA